MNIALLTEGWNRFYIMSSLNGMFARAKERGIDIFVAQFASFGDWCKNKDFNEGEYSVYKVTDFTDFDAIVLDVSDMKQEDIESRIFPIIKELNIPVLAIDSHFSGIHYISHNNYESITSMMEHLRKKHNVKSFAFFGGPEGTYEANVRKQAYEDSIKAFGLSLEDNPSYNGSYEAVSGSKNFSKLLKEHGKIPEAIVCCNDRIAIGALEEAKKYGYECPRDFRITGFDNYGDAERYSPQITTVGFNRNEVGRKTIDILCDLMEGKEIDEFVSIEGTMVFRESCGCNSEATLDYREYAKASVLEGLRTTGRNSTLTSLMAELTALSDFKSYFESLKNYSMSDSSTTLVACDKALFSPTEYKLFEGKIPEERLEVCFFVENGKRVEVSSFRAALAQMMADSTNSVVFITSLHFGSKVVGYFLTKRNPGDISVPDFLDAKYRFLFAGESLYKHLRQLALSQTLEGLYKRDQLTGIHNRIYFEEEMVGSFAKLYNDEKPAAVYFVDADNFKILNDTFGHAHGDKILKRIAKSVEKHLPEGGMCCRFGGDEFVAFAPCESHAIAGEYAKAVEEELAKDNISVSIGVAYGNLGSDLAEYVGVADRNMYQNKFRKLGDRRVLQK
ncbi:MAG: GGDEF domain-containing protein [Bacilli bacterium]|nr:GGDEF domain-containing protein [Bacilli bacterium]